MTYIRIQGEMVNKYISMARTRRNLAKTIGIPSVWLDTEGNHNYLVKSRPCSMFSLTVTLSKYLNLSWGLLQNKCTFGIIMTDSPKCFNHCSELWTSWTIMLISLTNFTICLILYFKPLNLYVPVYTIGGVGWGGVGEN